MTNSLVTFLKIYNFINTIFINLNPSSTVLAAKFGWFGRCFTVPRPYALIPNASRALILSNVNPQPS
jgi:hypothetical protein